LAPIIWHWHQTICAGARTSLHPLYVKRGKPMQILADLT
jgi:hypothetical protein